MRRKDSSLTPTHHPEDVRGHYAALASEYDRRANQACKQAYLELTERFLGTAKRILELGAGSSPLLDALPDRLSVAYDYSFHMLTARRATPHVFRVNGDAQKLPFRQTSFEAVFCINLLEHVPNPESVFHEAARVLVPGGRFLAVTPSGDVEWVLDMLERLRLKLPEGPHRFLRFTELNMAAASLHVLEHRYFLAFPAGPPGLVRVVDRVCPFSSGWGLFQYLLAEKAH